MDSLQQDITLHDKKVERIVKPVIIETIQQRLINLAYQNNVAQFKTVLSENIEQNDNSLDITEIKDKRDFTLIHIFALNDQFELLEFVIDSYLQNQQKTKQNESLKIKFNIQNWLDRRTDQGFTAIQFASFKGNYKTIQYLDRNGADIEICNYQGMNVLHMAAQGDQPLSIIYFIQKGIELNDSDSKGSTPLHWACYVGCEQSIDFLLKYDNIDINCIDKGQSMTPLHLAVINNNYKTTRKLLFKGADRSIKDSSNRMPIDIAIQNKSSHLIELLKQSNQISNFCRLKQKDISRNDMMFVYFVVLIFLVIYSLFYLFVIPFTKNPTWLWVNQIQTIIMILLFIYLCIKDPGYIVNKQEATLLELLINYKPDQICAYCEIIKPINSKHCHYCSKCVIIYDHHCPWLNNCIGANNHFQFLLFIINVQFNLLFIMTFILVHISDFKANGLLSIEQMSWIVYELKLVVSIVLLILSMLITFPIRYILSIYPSYLLITQIHSMYKKKGGNRKQNSNNSLVQNMIGHNKHDTRTIQFQNLQKQEEENNNNKSQRHSQSFNIEVPVQSEQQNVSINQKLRNCYLYCFSSQNNVLYQQI